MIVESRGIGIFEAYCQLRVAFVNERQHEVKISNAKLRLFIGKQGWALPLDLDKMPERERPDLPIKLEPLTAPAEQDAALMFTGKIEAESFPPKREIHSAELWLRVTGVETRECTFPIELTAQWRDPPGFGPLEAQVFG